MLRSPLARAGAATAALALLLTATPAAPASAQSVEPVALKQTTPVAKVVAGPATPTPTTAPVATTPHTAPPHTAPATTLAGPVAPAGAAVPTVPGDASLTALTAAPVQGPILIAGARGRYTNVYRQPDIKQRLRTFDSKKNFSKRTVFRVLERTGDFYKVQVPMRPNNTAGYVRVADVALYQHDYSIRVELAAHRLTVFKGQQIVMQEKVAVGQKKYPTPTGMFYLQELVRVANPRGAYGPYAFGLAAWSNVLTKFGRGDGQIGLHGTNQPQLLGTDVSHGCIRMNNTAITKLAKLLPQGVPIEIRA